MSLSPKHDRFCQEYIVDLNGTQAVIRTGYSRNGADVTACRLLGDPRIQARIAELRAEMAERTAITADRVLQELWAIATADPNELSQTRRTCCRHCYGEGGKWQRTDAEYNADLEWHQKQVELAEEKDAPPPIAFDRKGGPGFDARRTPVSRCNECFGEGKVHVFLHDTRNLSAAARRLYAGSKHTQSGIEIKTHDQQAALVAVGKHLGMFAENVSHTHITPLTIVVRKE